MIETIDEFMYHLMSKVIYLCRENVENTTLKRIKRIIQELWRLRSFREEEEFGMIINLIQIGLSTHEELSKKECVALRGCFTVIQNRMTLDDLMKCQDILEKANVDAMRPFIAYRLDIDNNNAS